MGIQFEVGAGFELNGTQGSVDVGLIPEDALLAAKGEIDARAEALGLWVPAGAGSLAVARAGVKAPDTVRQELLDGVEEGAKLYRGYVASINKDRARGKKIPVLKVGEYVEQAEPWLDANPGVVIAAAQLPAAADRPRLLVPRLNRAITAAEGVNGLAVAAGGKLWSWAGRMDFLSNWSDNQLSGFEEAVAEAEQTPYEVIPTAYDKAREGSVEKQKIGLTALQSAHPQIDVAVLPHSAVLARRYMGKPRQWQDSYVRAIHLHDPDNPAKVVRLGCVPFAEVSVDGDAVVRGSSVHNGNAARLLAREAFSS